LDKEKQVKDEQVKREKRKRGIVLILLLSFLIVASIFMFNRTGVDVLTQQPGTEEKTQLPTMEERGFAQDGELDLTDAETIKAGVQQKADDSMMNFKINTNPIYKDGEVNWMIENSVKNKGLVQVDVIKDGRVIYKSPTLKANQFIQTDKVDLSHLDKGTHEVLAMFSIYDENTKVKVGQSGVKFNLTIN
jgi:hypothetical protein